MYPSDDGPIRLRLLIAQSRAMRERLETRVAELTEFRARHLEVETPAALPQSAVEIEDLTREGREI